MKKILKARSICWVVFTAQGTHVSTVSLKIEKLTKKSIFCTKELLFKVCISKVELIATLPGSINEIDNKT